MRSRSCLPTVAVAIVTSLTFLPPATADETPVRGEVTDSETGKAIAYRIYGEGESGTWHFPKSEAKTGAAIEYRKQRSDKPHSVEMHTTLSAHPFTVTLSPGQYTFTVEHGKEYF